MRNLLFCTSQNKDKLSILAKLLTNNEINAIGISRNPPPLPPFPYPLLKKKKLWLIFVFYAYLLCVLQIRIQPSTYIIKIYIMQNTMLRGGNGYLGKMEKWRFMGNNKKGEGKINKLHKNGIKDCIFISYHHGLWISGKNIQKNLDFFFRPKCLLKGTLRKRNNPKSWRY